jgi:hypothetical protein
MMRSVVVKGLIEKRMFGKMHIGYRLTNSGRIFAKDGLRFHKEEKEEKKQVSRKTVNRSKLIVDLDDFAQKVVTAAARLKTIQQDRALLMEQVEALDQEEGQICTMLNGSEAEELLSRLVTLQKAKVSS